MTPQGKRTTIESIELYKQTLQGKNYSVQSIKAYLGDLEQFIEWLKKRRVDLDIPFRIQRIDIVEFINYLAAQKASSETRKRKLASIRGFLKFCKDNQIIFGNPADTIEDRSGRSAIRRSFSRRSTRRFSKWQGTTSGILQL